MLIFQSLTKKKRKEKKNCEQTNKTGRKFPDQSIAQMMASLRFRNESRESLSSLTALIQALPLVAAAFIYTYIYILLLVTFLVLGFILTCASRRVISALKKKNKQTRRGLGWLEVYALTGALRAAHSSF